MFQSYCAEYNMKKRNTDLTKCRAPQTWPANVSAIAPSAFSLPCINYSCLCCTSSQTSACLPSSSSWMLAKGCCPVQRCGSSCCPRCERSWGHQEKGMSGATVNQIRVHGWLQNRQLRRAFAGKITAREGSVFSFRCYFSQTYSLTHSFL